MGKELTPAPGHNGNCQQVPVSRPKHATFPGLTLRVFCIPVNPFTDPDSIRFSRHDEYADKENQRNPLTNKNHATEQGIRFGEYTPINGLPAGETSSVRPA
jgi:hypothetical protein